jgi:flagellar biosynthetic protein FlhB
MSEADKDKTEEPTQYRLEEARKRGEVARSMDVPGVVVMGLAAAIIVVTGADAARGLAIATTRMIAVSGEVSVLDGAFGQWASDIYAPVWQALAPLVLGLLVAAVLGHVMQTGPMLTTHPLKPDFKRMNPTQALKRIFSLRTLWELAKMGVKFALLGVVCVLLVRNAAALSEAVAISHPRRLASLVASTFAWASLYVLLILAFVAVVDVLFARREFTKKMRMSRRELKDEVKRRDGDPTVKSKQKQVLRELLKKARSVARIPDADVIITNPTHVAVALRYRPGETLAPIVIAKGAGLLARHMRSLAARHGVPCVRSPRLARALYRECDIDAMVPADQYLALAPIYRDVWARQAGSPA